MTAKKKLHPKMSDLRQRKPGESGDSEETTPSCGKPENQPESRESDQVI